MSASTNTMEKKANLEGKRQPSMKPGMPDRNEERSSANSRWIAMLSMFVCTRLRRNQFSDGGSM